MASTTMTMGRPRTRSLQPVRAMLLGGTVPLFLGALLSDIAYAQTYDVQWKNFASWLIVGGCAFAGLALLREIVELFRRDGRHAGRAIGVLLLLTAFVVGVLDGLVHAMDAWASMPMGMGLSAVGLVLAVAAVAYCLSGPRSGGLG